jgi:predicted NAD/FAD-binding protein
MVCPAEEAMRRDVTRREMLQTVGAVAAASAAGRAAALPRIGIVGGGMAGVSLAWLLDGYFDVTLLEAGPSIGGNVRGVDVDLDGHQFVVDLGAQYFHPGPYPVYTALLTGLGLYPPAAGSPVGAHSFRASITVAANGTALPRFVSPVLPDRAWPLLASWNSAGTSAFATCFAAAKLREQLNAGWSLTLGDWLPTLGLSTAQWEGMLLPWAASLFSGSIEQARGLSARAAMIFAARALPPNPLDPLLYYVLKPGMGEVLARLVDQCTTLQLRTSAEVQHVTKNADGTFAIGCTDGSSALVDHLVFASSGPATLQLLSTLPAAAQIAALQGIEFHDANLTLHTDPIYAPSHPLFWSFLNCGIEGPYCEASMWLAPVIATAPAATAAKLWKSWTTHRTRQPKQVLHEVSFRHMLPTPASLGAQTLLRLLQGRDGIWFAGGYTFPYDSQETALVSALTVAIGLGASTARIRALEGAHEARRGS